METKSITSVDFVKTTVENIKLKFKDPRNKQGKRHSFSMILRIIVSAAINGASTLAAMDSFLNSNKVKQYIADLTGKNTKIPKIGCIRMLLIKFPNNLLEKLNNLKGTDEFNGIAIAFDGKSLRKAFKPGGKSPALLNATIHINGMNIAQHPIDSKTNEIPEFINMAKNMNLREYLLTLDALHTQKKTAIFIVD